jgi:RsiW-degrading membrane proteinase PrsW (M82 family)
LWAAITAPLIVAYLIFWMVKAPLSPLLALAPLVLVGIPLYLIDRLAPHPIYARASVLIWGATVSIAVALVLEYPAAWLSHSNMVVVFVAGPVEELAIFSGLWWLCRRRDVTTMLDSVMLISWCALGFAAVEDAAYFARAPHHQLAAVFVGRVFFTPFGHPLFSSLSAVGYVVYRRRHQIRWLVAGLVGAAVLHTAWDATLVWIGEHQRSSAAGVVFLVFLGVFVGVFVTWVVLVFVARTREHRLQVFRLPHLARYVGLPEHWTSTLSSLPRMRRYRSSLPRSARAGFDGIVSTLVSMSHRAPEDPLQLVLAQTARSQYQAWESQNFTHPLAGFEAPPPGGWDVRIS